MQTRQPTKDMIKNKNVYIPRACTVGSTGWARSHTSSKKNSLKFLSGLQEFVLKVGEVCPLAAREAAWRHSLSKEAPQNREEQPYLSVKQSSNKVLCSGGKQYPQENPLHLNTALLESDFTQKRTHTEGPTRAERVMLLSSLSDSYPLPCNSYKTLQETFKSFFAPTSPLAKQE